MEHDAQLRRLGLFDARVPRYTSYPTAPHFAAGFSPDITTSWLGAIPRGAAISLYMHLPFCRRLCWFCACRTQGTSSLDPVSAYVEDLLKELRLLKRHLPEGITLSHLHWGGGTPTLLPPPEITRLAQAIFALAPMAEGGEFSVEIDPNELDGPRLAALARAGMNRASIGVQDFDPAIQQAIGRIQPFDLTRDVAQAIRSHGIRSLNTDLLYGLPEQTPQKIRQSVDKLLALSPDRIALYGYAHVPWVSRRQQMIDPHSLPGPEARLILFQTARDMLLAANYVEIGIDHFAKPADPLAIAQRQGRLRRNFQGYTDDTAEVLLGIGASSISRFPQGFSQNAPATAAYRAAIGQNRLAVAKGHVFGAEDPFRAAIIQGLMCDFRIERADLIARHPLHQALLDRLLASAKARFGAMVEDDGQVFSIPPNARALTRIIARHFDAYEAGAARHSIAV